MMRLLNMRQRSIEAADASCQQTMYLDTMFSDCMHTARPENKRSAYNDNNLDAMLRPRNLANMTGCARCCLQHDSIIFPVNVNQNHWVTVKLDMKACSIVCLDSLQASGVRLTLLAWSSSVQSKECWNQGACQQVSLNSVFLQDNIVSVVGNVLTWLHDEMSMTRHAECQHTLRPADEWVVR